METVETQFFLVKQAKLKRNKLYLRDHRFRFSDNWSTLIRISNLGRILCRSDEARFLKTNDL